jgi:uncharacterized protein
MKIVISPAKSLNYESELPTTRGTQPSFLETTAKINRKLSRLSKAEIAELMDISPKLADLNFQRIKNLRKNIQKATPVPQFMLLTGMCTVAWMLIPAGRET